MKEPHQKGVIVIGSLALIAILAVLGIGLAVVGLGWVGLFAFIIVSYIFLRASHQLEQGGGS